MRKNEAIKVTMTGFFVNVLLTIFKLFAGIIGNSSAMIADGIHSLSDFASDIVVMLSFKAAEKPEDDGHNYGHGRFETLSEIIISIMLIILGIGIAYTGTTKIISVINGEELKTPETIALYAALISVISKELLYRYTVSVGKKINSKAVIANAWHHRTDALSSVATTIGIGGAVFLGRKWIILDPITAVIVSILIIKTGAEILKDAMNEFLEGAVSKEEYKKINDIINSVDGVFDPHDIKTSKIGNKISVEAHINVKKDLTVEEGHEIATNVEENLKKAFSGNIYTSIHVEPK